MGRKNSQTLLLSLFLIMLSIPPLAPFTASQEENHLPTLDEILKKTGEYCQKLKNSVLDYVCIEEVTEATMFKEYVPDRPMNAQTRLVRKKATFTYDYQMIRKNRRINERRTLIEKNGKKCRIENAELETEFIKFANEILGPVGLLSLQRQSLYDYRILGLEDSELGPVFILEAVHKNPSLRDSLCGAVWIRASHFDVVRIEWDQRSLRNFASIQEIARRQGEEPSIRIVSEFAVKKKGLRFPSQTITEMAFVDENGKRDIRARTTVNYTQYRFFTVDTEIDYE